MRLTVSRRRHLWVLIAALAASFILLFGLVQGAPAQEKTDQEDGQQESTSAKSEQNAERGQEEGGPGSALTKGVSAEIPEASEQAASDSAREIAAPAPGLTEKGRADLESARQGEAQLPNRDEISDPQAEEASAQESEAPQLGTSFVGVNDSGWFPPDPTMAAGPDHLVVATNGAVNVLKKDGTLVQSQTLGGFFSALGTEHAGAFDPWLAYDPHINRFWIMAVSRDDATQRSDMVIGLSNSSDVTRGWTLWELNANNNGNTASGTWCDYPKLGFDAQAIYVTCNQFAFGGGFEYSKLRVMTKPQFVNNTGIRWWDFWNLTEGCFLFVCSEPFTMQPAQMLGATASDGMYLVDAHGRGGSDDALEVWRVTNPQNCCGTSQTAPTLQQNTIGVGSYGPSPGARQSGSTTRINNGDSRLLYAFWKNGRLSTGHTVACDLGADGVTDACAGYTELNVSSYPTLSVSSNFAFGANDLDYYYPAAAPNSSSNKTMVFSRSGPSEFAGTRYVGIDTNGNTDGSASLQAGQNSYVRIDGVGRNRWGDYLGASPDPDGTGVWIAGEFAAAAANTWGVQVGLTHKGAPTIPSNDDFANAQTISGSTASASGTTRSATREFNEPDHLVLDPDNSWIGDHSVWYRWTALNSGSTTIDTCTANIDSVLAVYTGSAVNGLSRVADNNNACSSGWGSKVTFNATAGTTYRIAVGDAGGLRQNTFTLSVNGAAPPDTDPPKVNTLVATNRTSTGVPRRNTDFLATFSEKMDPNTLNKSTYKLFKCPTTSTKCTQQITNVTVTPSADGLSATLNPFGTNATLLAKNTRYKVVVTTGTKDEAGNALDQNSSKAGNQQKVSYFKTGSG